jgi:hypothetical protein
MIRKRGAEEAAEIRAEHPAQRFWTLGEGTIHLFQLCDPAGASGFAWLSKGLHRACWLLSGGMDFGPEAPKALARKAVPGVPMKRPANLGRAWALIKALHGFSRHAQTELAALPGGEPWAKEQARVTGAIGALLSRPDRALSALCALRLSPLRLPLTITFALVWAGAMWAAADLASRASPEDLRDWMLELREPLAQAEDVICRLLRRIASGCNPERAARAFLAEVWGA